MPGTPDCARRLVAGARARCAPRATTMDQGERSIGSEANRQDCSPVSRAEIEQKVRGGRSR
jgi:hypothetical protein